MQGIAENLLSTASGTTQAAATSLGLQSQVVLVLVGLIGSGKSTFAQALQEHYPDFRRCSQDDLGDRRAVESLARRSLREGHSVCIDRTNIDARQRSTWISIAREIPGTEVWILHFNTPFEVCEERLRTRQNHPTITSLQQAVEILQRFRSQYQIPREHEGYDRELNLAVDEQQLGYTADDIRDILHRLQRSPKIEQSGRWTNRQNNPSYRGQSNYRGYAGSRGSSEYSRGSYYHRRGYSGYRGSGNYHGTSNYRGRGRGDNSTPYLRGNGSFSHSRAGGSYSSTYSTGDSRGNGEGSV